MNLKRVTYIALASFAFVASCTQGATEPDVIDWATGDIRIRPTIVEVSSSRAQNVTLNDLSSFQVTCFNIADYNPTATDHLPPHLNNMTFTKAGDLSYTSQSTAEWPSNSGLMRFFAFSPSVDQMKKDNPELNSTNRNDFFVLKYGSASINSQVSIDYRIDRMRVNPDISRQYDFITADVSGYKDADFSGGVDLAFRHQMSQVELKAWGRSSDYDIEIAGVRLGNPVVENSYIFSDAASQASAGGWAAAENAVTGKVEYLYRNTNLTGGIEGTGDKIYSIRKGEHDTEGSAASIMGIGGNAMVIPGNNEKWEGLADPNIDASSYETGKMYFSVLIRVTDAASGNLIYPYPQRRNGMTVITYAVDKDGVIRHRLYLRKETGKYYTDQWFSNLYEEEPGLEIHEFGWAAVPVEIDWKAGNRYVYTLNYTDGLGLHDPEEPKPGEPIEKLSSVSWSVSVDSWIPAEKNENYDPDLDVP